jgi:hypothetical protein
VTEARFALALLALLAGSAQARVEGVKEGVRYTIIPRTPEQIAAFYEARGLPPMAIDALAGACFFTVTLVNGSRDRVWVELERWELREAGGARLTRIARADWNARWDQIGVAAAQRATFGWTLLPEVRDLHPAEPVGGNLTVTPTTKPISLIVRLPKGVNKEKGEIAIEVSGLRCAGWES